MMRLRSSVELLAPAGDLMCVQAAIENGADAVYFGLTRGFNARARAENLSLENIKEIMRTLHARGVKGYVTLNTLVFPSELSVFEEVVRQVAASGVDAVLVQDLGAAELIRHVCPSLPIHASTQMTLTSAECIQTVSDLGIQRVVLPRELAVDEIRAIAAKTAVPLEVFVHGALCVAYSGQCLTSESLGGRSANRGQCAQACRLPYQIYCDGNHVDLDNVPYLLSPQDLAAYALLPELIAAGIHSFKIEGRLKSAEYVASVTHHYREAIDHAIQNQPFELTETAFEEMSLTFSRGFSTGWLEGCDHKRLVSGTSSAKRGIPIGEVIQLRGDRVRVRLTRSLRTGDGIMFDCGDAQNDQPGGRVFEIWSESGQRQDRAAPGVNELAFRRDSLNFDKLTPGTPVWKTDSPEVTRRLRQSFDTADPQHTMPLQIHVRAAVGEPLHVRASLTELHAVEVASEHALEAAKRHPITYEVLTEQLSRLGHTPYHLAHLTADIDSNPMVPLSVLGQLRRKMIEQLNDQLTTLPNRQVANESALPGLRPVNVATSSAPAQLTWLCRSLEQLQHLLSLGISTVMVDFSDIREYGTATQMARSAAADIWLATPRIHKPSETGIFRAMQRHNPLGILARNLAAIAFFREQGIRLLGDYSLNVANELTASRMMRMGLERLTVSYDLNRDQLVDLVDHTPPAWLEVVIHQHMPMFHMEHCVFCAVLSPGTNKTNCGRPCDEHVVHMQDRVGMKHRLTADVGCRNTLFNAQPQSAAEVVSVLMEKGIRSFRVELLGDETPALINTMHTVYQQLLAGATTGGEVLTTLNAVNRVGVTRGTLEAARDPLSIL